MAVFFRPSSSMEKNMKNAPKNPPAESIRCHVSTRVTGARDGEGGGICSRTDTGQIARHRILLCFGHGVQTKIAFKALLRDGRANKRRVVAVGQQPHGNG
jgi:hypothetical protein